jgi:hypothetical protein
VAGSYRLLAVMHRYQLRNADELLRWTSQIAMVETSAESVGGKARSRNGGIRRYGPGVPPECCGLRDFGHSQ